MRLLGESSLVVDVLAESAGEENVLRQHCKNLQHNKLIVVDGPKVKACVYGSTNFSWRGFYVQANNAVVVRGTKAIIPALRAFENYWNLTPAAFGDSDSAAAATPTKMNSANRIRQCIERAPNGCRETVIS